MAQVRVMRLRGGFAGPGCSFEWTRWIGYHQHAEADVVVNADLSLLRAHHTASEAELQLT